VRSRLLRTSLAASLIAIVATGFVAQMAAPVHAYAAPSFWLTYHGGGDYAFPNDPAGLSGISAFVVQPKHWLTLERTVTWELPVGAGANLQSVESLAGGAVLVADSAGRKATEYARDKTVAWSFGAANDPTLASVASARRISSGSSAGNTLICDPIGRQVIEVTPSKAVAWRFGSGDAAGFTGPVSARRITSGAGVGNTLICDQASGAILEVAPDKSIVSKVTSIGSPRDATRLADGTTLIVDEAGHRVVVLNGAGAVTWQFGTTDVAGVDATHLKAPVSAERLANGATVIADAGNGRVLRIASDKTVSDVTDSLSPAGAIGPGGATAGVGGAQLIADNANHRLVEVAYARSGSYTTGNELLAGPKEPAWAGGIAPRVSLPAGTAMKVEYRLDATGPWIDAGGGSAFVIAKPKPSAGVQYRFTFTSSDKGVSPLLSGWDVPWSLKQPSKLWSPPGSKTTTSTGTGNGSGVGNGTGGTGGGAGSGSGTGTHTGTQTGSRTAATSSSTGGSALTSTSTPTQNVQPPVSGEVLDKQTTPKTAAAKSKTTYFGIDPDTLVAILLGLSVMYGLAYPMLASRMPVVARSVRAILFKGATSSAP
jgi:hypothetical protein